MGHAGTLDPDATGVLVVAVGRGTRLMRYLSGHDKSYSGEVVLGRSTSTLDSSGETTGEWDMSAVTVDQAREAAARLTGEILQVPPMVSALKVGGRRLHELAREGVEVEREARPVTVHRFEVTAGPEPGVLTIEVSVSAGTYVRTLAADLGWLLGGGAHLRNLRRRSVGPWTEADTVTLDQLAEQGAAVLHPLTQALGDMAVVRVDEAQARMVGHGRVLDRSLVPGADGEGPWQVWGPEGRLLAVYGAGGAGEMRPEVVLAP